MAQYARILTVWTGGPGGPGLTVMNVRYTVGAITASLAAVRAFWQSFLTDFPSAYSCQVQGSADIHESDTGVLSGVISGTIPAGTSFSGAGNYAAGVGSQVKWITSGIHAGHRVQGRTFLVPLVSTRYDTDGTLVSSHLSTVNAAATTLISSLASAGTPLTIVSKPTDEAPAGDISDVTSGVTVDRVATLRTRRT
jgi:hypothetical protein